MPQITENVAWSTRSIKSLLIVSAINTNASSQPHLPEEGHFKYLLIWTCISLFDNIHRFVTVAAHCFSYCGKSGVGVIFQWTNVNQDLTNLDKTTRNNFDDKGSKLMVKSYNNGVHWLDLYISYSGITTLLGFNYSSRPKRISILKSVWNGYLTISLKGILVTQSSLPFEPQHRVQEWTWRENSWTEHAQYHVGCKTVLYNTSRDKM